MPLRQDLKSVLVIGSGPIVIGQACEFDYSGTQACRVLRSEGLRVILINSNPATIMTDPDIADATYVEQIDPEVIETIIKKERPDALLPTLGGQTALNAAIALHDAGVLEKYGVELIGADVDAIQRGEDRQKFKTRRSLRRRGADRHLPHLDESPAAAGSSTTGRRPPLVHQGARFGHGLTSRSAPPAPDCPIPSPTRSARGVDPRGRIRTRAHARQQGQRRRRVLIENVDPVGVHTGDSITVAPALTLTDREYQSMRDIGIAIIRAVGVDTGGCNIQFAVDPKTGRIITIEMNPRVSRSSALASKATGFPIAKMAAKLAVGYSLDEIPNDITKVTPASRTDADYVVVKIPRFTFEKFPAADSDPDDDDEIRRQKSWRWAATSPRPCRRRCARSSRRMPPSAGPTCPT